MKIDVKVIGTAELGRELKRYGARKQTALGQCLRREAELLLAKAIPYTPMRYGPLRASGRAQGPFRAGRNVSYALAGFGGPAVDYALYVHEMPDTYNFTTPGTGPKYMEKGVKDWMPGFSARVANCLRGGSMPATKGGRLKM